MRRSVKETGVVIDSGAANWQIFQQGPKGTADIHLKGHWLTAEEHKKARVIVRLLREDAYEEIGLPFTWISAKTGKDGSWECRVKDVPAGGLYRLETALQLNDQAVEWATRGDMVHHLGVGDVWMITGQSNSSGYGKTPVQDGPELGVHMFHASGEWQLAAHPLSDSTGSQYVANRERANGSHAPWLAFAKELKAALGYPIGLIPAALGGSPLSAWARSAGGHLFENMLGYFGDSGTTACKGVVWYQGESDAGDEPRAVYADRFREFVRDLRKDLRNKDLPVITVQLNRYIGTPLNDPVHRNWERMRELQRQIARREKGVTIISTLDLGLSDGIHNDSAGNLAIGHRCASVALGTVYGRPVKHLHPDLRDVTRKGNRLELAFDNVDTRLHYEGAIKDRFPIVVRDAAGDVPIGKWGIARDTLWLELDRELVGAAEVIGAPSAAPPTVVPFDICGYRPMLAFVAPVP